MSTYKVTLSLATYGIAGIVVAACDFDSQRQDDVVTRDSAGIGIVENHGEGWDTAGGWQIVEPPVLEIGAVSSPDPAIEFSRIGGVTRLTDGRIVVLENQASEIRYFGPTGQHLLTRGGRGGGPGEFNFAASLLRLPGDTILVEDRPRIRHVFFDPSGQYVRTEVLDQERYAAAGPWSECLSRPLPDGSLLQCRPEVGAAPQQPDPGPGLLRRHSRFVRTTIAVDTIIPLGRYGGLEQFGISAGGRTRFARHPFHSHTAVAAGGTPLRIAIAENPAYSIEVWTPAGELEQIIRRAAARYAPTAEDDERAREVLATYAMGDDALSNRFIAEVPRPDSAPAVLRLLYDTESNLWALRGGSLSRTVMPYDVFDRSGTFRGEVRLPHGFTPHEIGADYVLGVFRDESDVPFVRLYRLRK